MCQLLPAPDLNQFAAEVLSRPRIDNRCCLCGCEIMDHHTVGPSGRTHHGCEFQELLDLDMIDGPEWDQHPSTGFGDSADADREAWIESMEAAFADQDLPF